MSVAGRGLGFGCASGGVMMRGKWLGRALLLGLTMFLSANAGAQ